MIGYLRGKVAKVDIDYCYLDVQGVGYHVHIAESTRRELQEGTEICLFTYMHVREDAILLYGFCSQEEKELFLTLIGVSGIGPKVGLGILSNITPEAFKMAISTGDVAMLVRLPGIGKKSAERLVLELKDKLKGFSAAVIPVSAATPVAAQGVIGETLTALQSLGYSIQEVQELVQELSQTHTTVQSLLKAALAELGKRR